jgi:hypothetical protein
MKHISFFYKKLLLLVFPSRPFKYKRPLRRQREAMFYLLNKTSVGNLYAG